MSRSKVTFLFDAMGKQEEEIGNLNARLHLGLDFIFMFLYHGLKCT